MTALQQARHERGLTQVQLARRVGFTQQAVSLVERGGSAGCAELRRRLAVALNADERELFGA